MSGRIVLEVMENAPSDLTKSEMAVLLVLAENARDKPRSACLAAEVIAHRARVTVATVYNVTSRLALRGLIVPQLRARIGTTQRYVLPIFEPHHRSTSLTPPRGSRLTDSGASDLVGNHLEQGASLTSVGSSLTERAHEPHPEVRPLRKPPIEPPRPLSSEPQSERSEQAEDQTAMSNRWDEPIGPASIRSCRRVS